MDDNATNKANMIVNKVQPEMDKHSSLVVEPMVRMK